MTEKEQLFREKANSYVGCFSDTCPLRAHCLRSQIRPYLPKDNLATTSINLCNPKIQTKNCPMFRSDEPVRMPYGLKNLYHDMPGWMEKAIKHDLIRRYSRKRYYEYHNGTRLITPDIEGILRQVLLAHGWNQEPLFSGYKEEYIW